MAGVFTDITMMAARLHRQPHHWDGSEKTTCSFRSGKTDRALVAIASSARHEPAPVLRALAPNARQSVKTEGPTNSILADETSRRIPRHTWGTYWADIPEYKSYFESFFAIFAY